MLSQPIVGVSLMILCLLAWIMQRVRASFLRSHEALRRGCEDAPTRINKCPGGIDHVARLLIADRDGQVPTEYLKIYEEQGEHTYAHTILGVTQVMTIEPPNIQAVLATQFQDFEVGPIRRKNFAPLLGNGIFTADGKFWYTTASPPDNVNTRYSTLIANLGSVPDNFFDHSSLAGRSQTLSSRNATSNRCSDY